MLVKKSLVQGFFCESCNCKAIFLTVSPIKLGLAKTSLSLSGIRWFQWVQIKKIFQPLNIESSDCSTICVQFLKTKTPIVLADTPPPPTLLGPSSFSGTSGRQQAGLSRIQGGQLCFDAVVVERESERRLLRVYFLSENH